MSILYENEYTEIHDHNLPFFFIFYFSFGERNNLLFSHLLIATGSNSNFGLVVLRIKINKKIKKIIPFNIIKGTCLFYIVELLEF